jgi:hypothetical protein
MLTQSTVQIGTHEFILSRMDEVEQFECECILFNLVGPAAAAAVGSIVDTFAVQLVKFIRQIAGEGEDFDLAKLLALRDSMSTKDIHVQAAWDRLLTAVEQVGSEILTSVVPAASDRVDFHKVIRLFELLVLRKTHVAKAGAVARLDKFAMVTELTRRDPRVKWQLMIAALLFNYTNLDAVEPVTEVASE